MTAHRALGRDKATLGVPQRFDHACRGSLRGLRSNQSSITLAQLLREGDELLIRSRCCLNDPGEGHLHASNDSSGDDQQIVVDIRAHLLPVNEGIEFADFVSGEQQCGDEEAFADPAGPEAKDKDEFDRLGEAIEAPEQGSNAEQFTSSNRGCGEELGDRAEVETE